MYFVFTISVYQGTKNAFKNEGCPVLWQIYVLNLYEVNAGAIPPL